jgi:hypothetical protein
MSDPITALEVLMAMQEGPVISRGPRMAVGFLGGWNDPSDLHTQPAMLNQRRLPPPLPPRCLAL